MKIFEVFATIGGGSQSHYDIGTPLPTGMLDMQGVEKPFPNDIAERVGTSDNGVWVPASATADIATKNWQAAWVLKESRIHEHITVYGVDWWATRESLSKMKDAVDHHADEGLAVGYTQRWRLPNAAPRPTTLAEMKEVMRQMRARWKLVEDSYTLWTEGDKQTPWTYP